MPSDASAERSARDVGLSIFYYTVCSSIMLVANKVAVVYIPVPACVFTAQIAASVLWIVFGQASGLFDVDGLTLPRVRTFLPYTVAFVAAIYFNGRALQISNVETVIVFRASGPLVVSILDWALLGRHLPSARSTMALLGVVAGAVGYVLADGAFALHGLRAYSWVSMYMLMVVFEMTYGKKLLSRIDFKASVWGPVYYTNVLALPPIALLGLAAGEFDKLKSLGAVSFQGGFALVLSCVVGVGISWAGWFCRDMTSATTYTLVGVLCKLLSVLMNILIWDKHATPMGVGCLLICLVSSSLYRQAPMREKLKHEVDVPKEPLASTLSPKGASLRRFATDVEGGLELAKDSPSWAEIIGDREDKKD